jgi:hypothetical protein
MAKVLFRVSHDLAWLHVDSCVELCGEGVSSSPTNFEGGGKHAPNTPITLTAPTTRLSTDAMKGSCFVTTSYQLPGWADYAQSGRLVGCKTLACTQLGGVLKTVVLQHMNTSVRGSKRDKSLRVPSLKAPIGSSEHRQRVFHVVDSPRCSQP